MNKIVISGSAKLSKELKQWNQWWQKAGYEVLYCPKLIDSKADFPRAYKDTYEHFYKSLLNSDLLFLMNENKNDKEGYIGAQTFAEASYAITNNLIGGKKITEVVILKMPSKEIACYQEITMWLELGWAVLFEKWINDQDLTRPVPSMPSL